MGERVTSDHPSIRTFRATVAASGATSRPRIELPPESRDAFSAETARLVLAGSTYHADMRVTDAGPVIHGVYNNARLARTPAEGENHLPGWVEEAGLSIGRSVLIDEVVPATLFGARAPGTTAVYDAVEPPQSSLVSIAEELDE